MPYYETLTEIILNKFLDISHTTLFNKAGILSLIEEIKLAPSKDIATNRFQVFVVAILAIIDELLTIDNPEFQNSRQKPPAKLNSVKVISKILNAGKFIHSNGVVFTVNVDKYLKIEAFKKNKDIALLKQLVILKMNFNIVLKFLFKPHDPLGLTIAYNFNEEITKLKNEKDRVVETTDKALEIIKKFDKEIKKLYQCTTSQVFSELTACIFSPTYRYTGIEQLQTQLGATFPRKNAVFLLGDYPTEVSMSKQIKVIYISALNYLRTAALTLDENETTLLPAVVLEKQKIMREFNLQFKELFHSLKLLNGEVTHKHYKKAELNYRYTDEIKEPAADNESKEEKISSLLVLSREITPDELLSSEALQLTLKNDSEYLLIESELAFKIVEIYQIMLNVNRIFAETPHHLHRPPERALKSDLEIYFNKLELAAAKVKTD
jgi:hypothetical protein